MEPPPELMCVGGSASTQIMVVDNDFSPASDTISVNSPVTWTWSGINPHNVTFTTGPQPLPATSCTQVAGTHTVTFRTAGQYNYSCTIHTGMDGSVTVTP